jgi:glycine/D-amino acid oxidase-like deaminating enzyme
MADPGALSYWHDSLVASGEDDFAPRAALDGPADVDVAIVGAGFTGLWTALSLLRSDPSVRVVVIEREFAGFGASGRNGGWCSALFPATWEAVAAASSRSEAIRLQRTMHDTVGVVAATLAEEGIDAELDHGGTVLLARSPQQRARAEAEVARARSWGFGPEDYQLLDAAEAQARFSATRVEGALVTPHCAAVHPARLVRGLARAVERHGGRIVEGTAAVAIERGRVRTTHGTVRADVVVRATEGYTAGLPGHERALVPVYSLMLATEPLAASVWDELGLAERATFSDLRHMVIYGQRTRDGRFAFGGRGAPYRFGSRVSAAQDQVPAVTEWLRRTLVDLVPAVADARITHAWGGPLGIARDWWASVGLDRSTGLAWAGGYVGDGVGTSNLAGRTLADLILGHDTELTTLPWVGHRSRRWEPEPLRWVGVNAGLRAMGLADPEESVTGRSSVVARTFGRLIHG